MINEFRQMKPYLEKAKIGSFLIIPLKYDKNQFNFDWLSQNAQLAPFETMDINESVKQIFNGKDRTNVLSRFKLDAETVHRQLLNGKTADCFYACEKGNEDFTEMQKFTIHSAEIYIFHTQVAFLSLEIRFSRMALLDTIVNLGYVDSNVEYFYNDQDGTLHKFDFEAGIISLCHKSNLQLFFETKASVFLEGYTYTTAVVEKRFENMETIRRIAFNLHLMVEPEMEVEDDSEEDVNFTYAVKDQTIGSYRWGCCVTSQTISYVVADSDMDISGEIARQAENGLPVVLLALYQKYTCLRFKELISIADKKKSKRLKALKRQLLEFQAYGTITPANISRWNNVRRTYRYILQANAVSEAVEDISVTLNLLTEQQKEIETAKSDAIMGMITLFSIVSIPTSIIGFVDVLMGGNSMNIITAVVSLVSVVFVIILMLLYKERT